MTKKEVVKICLDKFKNSVTSKVDVHKLLVITKEGKEIATPTKESDVQRKKKEKTLFTANEKKLNYIKNLTYSNYIKRKKK